MNKYIIIFLFILILSITIINKSISKIIKILIIILALLYCFKVLNNFLPLNQILR